MTGAVGFGRQSKSRNDCQVTREGSEQLAGLWGFSFASPSRTRRLSQSLVFKITGMVIGVTEILLREAYKQLKG